MLSCEFCNAELASSASLKHHQSKTKYCLEKQKKPLNLFECKDCDKNFTTKRKLISHQEICLPYNLSSLEKQHNNELYKKDFEISELRKQIKELQDKMEHIAIKAVSRPVYTTSNKTQINNFIQQLQPVIDEKLKDSVINLTIDHIKKGPEGYAQYALEYPLKDKMICVDYSRRKVKFKDKDGTVITDPEMTGLASKFFNSIKDKNKELICLYANELREKLGCDDIMDTMVNIFDYKTAVDRCSDGEKTEFHHDFVRQICSKTVKE
jgi:hypothetical protein